MMLTSVRGKTRASCSQQGTEEHGYLLAEGLIAVLIISFCLAITANLLGRSHRLARTQFKASNSLYDVSEDLNFSSYHIETTVGGSEGED